ncbi:MerR family transcriptional regulator [Streptomyces sp. MW-W600-10]|uniref:MerR family transcriptional regulator n=1 Tax=Streptomyces sp. MW-W600-10 TaxID=2829819 RepID=UPI001C44EC39|nr:MerR family transcriptional regulator [Streptomyces sp. MW-W600-10]MBV7247737.1 MerR family transcriptional regulator [Streptomyces sp. MW-W600-10]
MGRVAELAGVSVRTLHHYDGIGLVRPSARTAAGYRAYAAGDVERLREVLAYRRLGFGLREIAELVDDPSADAVAHLHRLRGLLLERRDRADAMVTAIDRELRTRAKGLEVTPEEQLNMLGARLYDAIKGAYTATRRTDPRIAAQIRDALGDARTVLNVGAGTGSYEPADRRVARHVVVLTFDTDEPGWQDRFWLTRDYLPEFTGVLAEFPSLAGMADAIGARAEPVPVPWDCADGLFEAYWRRPGAYLEERVRRAMSVWTRVGPEAEERAVRSLGDDLASGRWAERNGDLVGLDAADLGLRLLRA